MNKFKPVRLAWHKLWRNYNALLYDSCIDEQLKVKLESKVTYHENKLKSILSS